MLALTPSSVAPHGRSGLTAIETMRINAYGMQFNDASLALHRHQAGWDVDEKGLRALSKLAGICTSVADYLEFFEPMGEWGVYGEKLPSWLVTAVVEHVSASSGVLRALAGRLPQVATVSEQDISSLMTLCETLDKLTLSMVSSPGCGARRMSL